MNAELIKQLKPDDLICITQGSQLKYKLFHKYTGRSIQFYSVHNYLYSKTKFYKSHINVTDYDLLRRVTVPDFRFVDKTILDWYIEIKQEYDKNIK